MASEALSTGAEALREKLHRSKALCEIDNTCPGPRMIARTIVEQLGLTEESVDDLEWAALDCEGGSRHETATQVRSIANALSTLLELAGAEE